MDAQILRVLVDTKTLVQKSRIAFGNRVYAAQEGNDTVDAKTERLIEAWEQAFLDLENKASLDIAEVGKDIPIIEKMIKVRGVSFQLASRVASRIDITRADTVSALWRHAGYAVIDGKREYCVAGEPSHYDRKLKSSVYLVTESLLKQGAKSPYTPLYYDAKEKYREKYGNKDNEPYWTPLHIHRAALRKMGKMWLSHLWTTWRQLEGLPTRNLYVEEYMGHTAITKPEDFGW